MLWVVSWTKCSDSCTGIDEACCGWSAGLNVVPAVQVLTRHGLNAVPAVEVLTRNAVGGSTDKNI